MNCERCNSHKIVAHFKPIVQPFINMYDVDPMALSMQAERIFTCQACGWSSDTEKESNEVLEEILDNLLIGNIDKDEAIKQIRRLMRDSEKPISVRDRPPSQLTEIPWPPMQ